MTSTPRSPRSVQDLHHRLADDGAKPAHTRRILTAWLRGESIRLPRHPNPLRPPLRLETILPELQARLDALVVELSHEGADDGGTRRLLQLESGATIEVVDLPRDGLCLSTQVGCAVGCRFCRTGEDGLLEQLSSLEILAQVAHARRRRRIRRVVFMGMGEPAHNVEAVLEAIAVLGQEGNIAHKNLVFSTVGAPDVFDRLRLATVRPALALSLHTLDPARRRALLPRAPQCEPDDLLDAGLRYAEDTGYPLQLQWTLLDGVSDSLDEARRLAARLEGRRVIVNYIPFNLVEGSGFGRPAVDRCVELVRTLRRRGVVATLRFSSAAEVEGGCGQLRARRSLI